MVLLAAWCSCGSASASQRGSLMRFEQDVTQVEVAEARRPQDAIGVWLVDLEGKVNVFEPNDAIPDAAYDPNGTG